MLQTEDLASQGIPAATDTVYYTDTTDYLAAALPAAKDDAWHPLSLDSVFSAYQPREVLHHRSIFTGHSLQPVHQEAIPVHHHDAPSWFLGLAALVLALISIFIHNTRIQAHTLVPAAFNIRDMERLYRENNFGRGIAVLPMMLFYAASLTLSIFAISHDADYSMLNMHGWSACLLLFAILVSYFLLKTGFISLLGNVFNDKVYSLYISNNYVYQFIGSFLLLPLALIVFFGNIGTDMAYNIILIPVSILFIMRLSRGIKLILTLSSNSKFYLFYYLCTLEIVPLLIAGKHFFAL